MNKQGKLVNGKPVGGIEWTHRQQPDGTWQLGYTWNPIAGCQHGCRWDMPDGTTAICYAEAVANKFRSDAIYPEGFEHHYWKPDLLKEPGRIKTPSRIFVGSMADVFGHWVPDDQIRQVLDVVRKTPQHQFQFLTKNAPRLAQFDFPDNAWIGVSAPPTEFMGHAFTNVHRAAYVTRAIRALKEARCKVRWMSIEPLSFDIAPLLEGAALDWAVIGAATNGPKAYQPKAEWVQALLDLFDRAGTKVFFKGNLKWPIWREEFPE